MEAKPEPTTQMPLGVCEKEMSAKVRWGLRGMSRNIPFPGCLGNLEKALLGTFPSGGEARG
jgi:hypothetical protein